MPVLDWSKTACSTSTPKPVTRFTEPVDGQYRRIEPLPAGEPFALSQVSACLLTTTDIFG